MKKFLKFTLLTAMIIVLAMSLVACGNKEENGKESNKESNIASTELKYSDKSKTYNAMMSLYEGDTYKMVIAGESDDQQLEITTAKKGDKMYMSMKDNSDEMIAIIKDGKSYIIMPSEKQYMETEIPEGEDPLAKAALVTDEELKTMKDAEYKTGKEEINGTEYDYEEYTEDEVSIRYYFEGNTLKYIKDVSSKEVTEVKEITSNVPDSLFDVPSEYEKVEM